MEQSQIVMRNRMNRLAGEITYAMFEFGCDQARDLNQLKVAIL